MPDAILQDTRDRVISLAAKFDHLERMVEKNSTILAEMHELHQQAKGGLTLGRLIVGSAKGLGSGGAGAALMWAAQHFGKLA